MMGQKNMTIRKVIKDGYKEGHASQESPEPEGNVPTEGDSPSNIPLNQISAWMVAMTDMAMGNQAWTLRIGKQTYRRLLSWV